MDETEEWDDTIVSDVPAVTTQTKTEHENRYVHFLNKKPLVLKKTGEIKELCSPKRFIKRKNTPENEKEEYQMPSAKDIISRIKEYDYESDLEDEKHISTKDFEVQI